MIRQVGVRLVHLVRTGEPSSIRQHALDVRLPEAQSARHAGEERNQPEHTFLHLTLLFYYVLRPIMYCTLGDDDKHR